MVLTAENRDKLMAEIAQEVIARLKPHLGGNGAGSSSTATAPVAAPAPAVAAPVGKAEDGVFETIDDAVKAAAEAQPKIARLSLDDRDRIIGIIRHICDERAYQLGRMEFEETKIGRLDHKIDKLRIVSKAVGVEALRAINARTDQTGMCLVERAPWGVIGMILPVTHSVPTMVGNAINVLAAGNAAVFNPHPGGAKVAAYALQLFNREIQRQFGIANALTTVAKPTIRTAEELFHHPGINLICVTGGPAVVKAATKSGKRVIAAGPGNPPVVVDESADLDAAAIAIIDGAAFDNNLLCIGEKEVFVVEKVADAFIKALRKAGAVQLDAAQVDKLTRTVFTLEDGKGCARGHVKKEYIGKDAAVLAEAVGVKAPAETKLLFGETPEEHAFVNEEQMMPFVPVVRVRCVGEAIQAALRAEHGYRHTAVIHSRNLENITEMARVLNTTLFVANAPSTASLGANAPSYLSYSIATPTGEGVTTPLTFTRERQITIGGGALRIV
jgi:aldehyde dehydrogenase